MRTEERRHRDERPDDTQPEPLGGGEVEREEEEVGQAEAGGLSVRQRKAEAQVREHVRVLRDDVPGRAAEDGVGVDPRDDQRDDHEQDELLEELQEPEGEERDRGELREVREHLEVADLGEHGQHAERGRDGEQPARVGERQDDQVEREDGRDQEAAEQRDVPPVRQRRDLIDA